MANSFTYTELHTNDPEKAKAFYKKLFDWKTNDMALPFGTYTEINAGEGIAAGLRTPEPAGIAPQWMVYVKVGDVAASTHKAKELGAKALREVVEIPEGRFSVLADPTGAVFGLFEPREAK